MYTLPHPFRQTRSTANQHALRTGPANVGILAIAPRQPR